jgi:hypothetical protein
MNENKINWPKIEKNIQELKFPLSFTLKLFKNSSKFNDTDFSLILRYFLKYNYELAIKYKLLNFIIFLDHDKINTKRIIKDFYTLIRKKIIICILLKKWRESYNKNNFWNLSIENQIEKLKNLKEIFLANFDVTKSNHLIHYKISNIIKRNNNLVKDHHLEILKNRLRNIFLIFGRKFFRNYNILTLTNSEFSKFDFKNQLKYCDYIFNKINKIIFKIINYFVIINSIQNQLDNILNPDPILFDNGDNKDFETKLEDILFIIEN